MAVLENADKFELVSVDPSHFRPPWRKNGPPPPANDFHGYDELGRTALEKADQRTVIKAVSASMAAWDGQPLKCGFEPRHAIVASSGSEVAEVLICYECGDVMTYFSGNEKGLNIARDQGAPLDKILTAAGIQLAPKAD